MGMLVDGLWKEQDAVIDNGQFIRPKSVFLGISCADLPVRSSAGNRRYTLFGSLSCPWSHRTMLMYALKDLGDSVSLHIAGEPRTQGYALDGGRAVDIPGVAHPIRFLHQLYTAAKPGYTGRVTVPVLWDGEEGRIVNNESSEIMRLLNTCFDDAGAVGIDLYPAPARAEIDTWNAAIYGALNDGVYRAGFAETQAAYDEAVSGVFAMLDELETHLSCNRYLAGGCLSEADLRLFVTLVRFDPVYHGHFKCSRRRLADYPALSDYLADLMAVEKIAQTVDIDAVRHAYYFNDRMINPFGIVPLSADRQEGMTTDREALGPARVAATGGGWVDLSSLNGRRSGAPA